jgi:predicted  nucleic acid-binding Zn-ribbon protein
MDYLALQRTQISQELDLIEQRYWQAKNSNNLAEQEISDLRDKLRIMTSKNEELEKKLNNSAPELKRLNDRLEEQRAYAAVAMTQESEMRDQLSHELMEKRLL